ncbi:folate family ECF transporter S component [Candidatus Cryosericum terrychapinii]|nr:folate family ECF transporter S component [Candidatus Cryosericum terrychapinii]
MANLEERNSVLEREIVKHVDQGWRVVSQMQTSVQLTRDKRVNWLIALLLALVLIVPAVLYLLLYKGTENLYLEVREDGQVVEHRNPVEGKPDRARIAIRVLTLDGLMIGLSIVLTRLMSLNVPIGGGIGARIGLGHLPIVVTGIVAGPLSGLLVGAAADLVGFAIWPSGTFIIWQITAISALNGVIPWVFVKLGWPRSRTARIWIGVTVARLLLSVGWLPLVLHDVEGLPYWSVVAGQAAASVVMVPATAFFVDVLVKAYERSGYGRLPA